MSTCLIWSLSGDAPAEAVLAELRRRGADVVFADQRELRYLSADVIIDGTLRGKLQIGGRTVTLDDVSAMYIRPYDARRMREIRDAGPTSPLLQRSSRLEQVLLTWADVCQGIVINRLETMALNNSKPWQLAEIHRHGMRVPETLVTTDPEAVRAFATRHERLIYKSVSGERSIVRRLEPRRLERLGNVQSCPTQFQEWIAGVDVRVHVVGGRFFAREVVSDADDYRYAGDGIETQVCELDLACASRLVAMVRTMGLVLAGVDLRRTADGEWVCLEVNPSPGFTFYEPNGETPIRSAIADVLTGEAG